MNTNNLDSGSITVRAMELHREYPAVTAEEWALGIEATDTDAGAGLADGRLGPFDEAAMLAEMRIRSDRAELGDEALLAAYWGDDE